MMKIQMLTSQPLPEAYPPLPCYLAGQTYTLATAEEIAMGKDFIASGVAVAITEATPEAPLDAAQTPRKPAK